MKSQTTKDSPPQFIIIGRYDPEITLKSRPVRLHFQSLVCQHLSQRFSISHLPLKVEKKWDSFITYLPNQMAARLEKIEEILRTTFGVDRFYLAKIFASTNKEKIKEYLYQEYHQEIKKKTFAVRVKVRPKGIIHHQQLEAELGGVLYPLSKGVNLEHPEVLIRLWLDLEKKVTYFILKEVKGPAGYPYGSSRTALVLFSGGIDSPVAAWLAARKGLHLNFFLLNQAGKEQLKLVQKEIQSFYDRWLKPEPSFLYIAEGKEVREIIKTIPPRYRSFVFKYLLYRWAYYLSQKEGIPILVSGESLNQVSTQTPSVLATCQSDQPEGVLIFRPLSGLTKREIINRARTIGTLSLSEQLPEYCLKSKEGSITKANKKLLKELETKFFPTFTDKLPKLRYRKISLQTKD